MTESKSPEAVALSDVRQYLKFCIYLTLLVLAYFLGVLVTANPEGTNVHDSIVGCAASFVFVLILSFGLIISSPESEDPTDEKDSREEEKPTL